MVVAEHRAANRERGVYQSQRLRVIALLREPVAEVGRDGRDVRMALAERLARERERVVEHRDCFRYAPLVVEQEGEIVHREHEVWMALAEQALLHRERLAIVGFGGLVVLLILQ